MKKYFAIFVLCFLMTMTVVAYAEAVDAQPGFSIDLTQIIVAVIALLSSLITAKLIPWIQANTNEKQQMILQAAVMTAVYAAEQIYGAGGGEEKLNYVKSQLRKKGYTVDIDEIEAAVLELTSMQNMDV